MGGVELSSLAFDLKLSRLVETVGRGMDDFGLRNGEAVAPAECGGLLAPSIVKARDC